MTFKRILRLVLVIIFLGLVVTPASFSAIPERLETALRQCPKWIKLSAENTHFIWDLPNQKKPFLLQMESACYPGLLETRQIEILKEWVAQGNILWILFNPLRANIPGNQDWAAYFGLKSSLSLQSALITRKDGKILPVKGLTEGVEILQLGTPNVSPSYDSFEGNILPVLKTGEGAVVFGGQNFGAGRIIFDGFGWLFFETEKDWLDPLVYDSQVFWVNFFKWARACNLPVSKKEESVGPYVAPPPASPAPLKKEKIDCNELGRDLKNKFPHLEIKVQERPNGECVFSLDRVLFDTGKADLRDEGRKVLNEIVELVKINSNYRVRIEGHTDSMLIRGRLKKKFPSNWELSRARAEAVYQFIFEAGRISKDRLATEGFADTRSLASNQTQEGRQQNRRTEIILFISRTFEKQGEKPGEK
jgi:flagellar motor protein MotB